MLAIQEAMNLVSTLSPPDKAQLLQWVVQNIGNHFPGIEITEGVVGGSACVVRTRIPVWTLVLARKSGYSDAKILTAYPNLRAEDIANAWAYYNAHRTEIDQEIIENETA